MTVQEGDILGFSGTGFLSGAINIGTGAFPGRGLCHVGIAGRHPLTRQKGIYESTMLFSDDKRDYCAISHRPVKGVQFHTLAHVCQRKGNIWWYPSRFNLSEAEKNILQSFLVSQIGKPYDLPQAGGSFGLSLRAMLRTMFTRESLDSLFCSELVGAAVDELFPGSVKNASLWNPNTLMRHLLREDLYSNKLNFTP